MARPSKFTQATVDRLLQAVRLGATYELAAKSAGITYHTFNNWHQGVFPRGADSNLKMEFLDGLTRAEGEGALQWLAVINRAAKDGDWRAAMTLLERRYPREYGRHVVEQTGTVNVNLIADQIAADLGLSSAEVIAEAERIVAQTAGGA